MAATSCSLPRAALLRDHDILSAPVVSSRAAWRLPRAALRAFHPCSRRAEGRQQSVSAVASPAAAAAAAAAGGNGALHRSQPGLDATPGQRHQQQGDRQQHRHQNGHAQQQEQELEPPPLVWTKFVAETLLPTKQGRFRLRGYRHTVDGGRTFTEPSVIIAGEPEGGADVPVRVHDACFTSEVLGSLKCDCREQLELALDFIREHPPGMVIYLQQEGRGIGLANKIAAYALQEKGLDTVDANRALGLPDDCREYSAVAHILSDLGVSSVRLMTNNPRKLSEMAALGVAVTGRIPCQVQAQQYNAGYLSAKKARMAHMLTGSQQAGSVGGDDAGDTAATAASAAAAVGGAAAAAAAAEEEDEGESDGEALEGQFCFWDHEGEPSSAGIPLDSTLPLPEGLQATAGWATAPVPVPTVVASPLVDSGGAAGSVSGAPASGGGAAGTIDG